MPREILERRMEYADIKQTMRGGSTIVITDNERPGLELTIIAGSVQGIYGGITSLSFFS